MKYNNPITVALAFCLLAAAVQAQSPVDTREHIFDEAVRTLKVAPASNPYLPSIYVMGSNDCIEVNFDYLDYELHYLRYSVTHCDANWQPSVLVESEYVDGFNYADIEDYEQSNATFTHYYNYNFRIPNDNLRITKSGNYLLSVYEQDDPERILFQTRFSVSENRVGVAPAVTSATDWDYNGHHQQVSFTVNYKPGTITDPYNELTAVVSQNTRTANQVMLTRPMMVSGNSVSYESMNELIFNAGNEYRRFEHVNINSLNMGVAAIQYFEPFYHATLYLDEPRAESQYLYDSTQHGHFTIRNAQSTRSRCEADYVVTHFMLNTGEKLLGGRVILEGEFTHGLPIDEYTMRWDENDGCYRADLLLKQGAYNYQYLWLPDGAFQARTSNIEGDHYQTANEYTIMVYDRPMGERYDHLVGHAVVHFN